MITWTIIRKTISVRVISFMAAGLFLVAACAPKDISATPQTVKATASATPLAPVGAQAQWEKLVTAAKNEKEVMVYSAGTGEVMRALAAAFESKYGIRVDFVTGRAPEISQKIVREREAGLYLVDAVIAGGPAVLVTMKPQGYIDGLDPVLVLPEVVDPKVWVQGVMPFNDKEHTHIKMVATVLRYMMRNTDMTTEGDLKSYEDLLNPKWKGKIAMVDPTTTGSALNFVTLLATDVWGLDKTLEFLRKLVAQDPVVTRDLRLQLEWVSKGKYPIAVAPQTDVTAEFVALGAPVASVQAVEGGQISAGVSGLAVVKNRPHPNATTVFVNWLLSREGNAIYIKSAGQPSSRVDVKVDGIPAIFYPQPGEKLYSDSETTILFQDTMMQRAREIFGPLIK